MIKYVSTQITFSEVPGKITRCFSISTCGLRCKGCHSPELQEDCGDELTLDILKEFIKQDKGKIDCYCFLGIGTSQDKGHLKELLKECNKHKILTCLYTGHPGIDADILLSCKVDYFKLGPYIEEKGGLDNPNTNQRFYKVTYNKHNYKLQDITHMFHTKKEEK